MGMASTTRARESEGGEPRPPDWRVRLKPSSKKVKGSKLHLWPSRYPLGKNCSGPVPAKKKVNLEGPRYLKIQGRIKGLSLESLIMSRARALLDRSMPARSPCPQKRLSRPISISKFLA